MAKNAKRDRGLVDTLAEASATTSLWNLGSGSRSRCALATNPSSPRDLHIRGSREISPIAGWWGNRTWAANLDSDKPLDVTGVRTDRARPRDFMVEGHGAAHPAHALSMPSASSRFTRPRCAGWERVLDCRNQALGRSECRRGSSRDSRPFERARSRRRRRARRCRQKTDMDSRARQEGADLD